ncbi:hypothetical protein DFJ43DRAFT_1094253 [Lentinula guzmanii]|uniref:Uncharacterized protein n=1 Tax=Lentinula guzmanii TaxID=2804957 RepID=A0AA38JJN3_9AGAR|nr:hypothetical protein DFJ43DRAFT_1094253 [Lentinula guzmanii]
MYTTVVCNSLLASAFFIAFPYFKLHPSTIRSSLFFFCVGLLHAAFLSYYDRVVYIVNPILFR